MNEVRRSKQGQDGEELEDGLGVDETEGVDESEEEEKEPSVEVYERVVYEIKAVNRSTALRGLDSLLQSQDKVVKVRQIKGTTFEANVLVFRLRDF